VSKISGCKLISPYNLEGEKLFIAKGKVRVLANERLKEIKKVVTKLSIVDKNIFKITRQGIKTLI